ncbi:MAG: DUF2321 domain-containing protein [Acidimicrobiales bacterium]
MEAVCKRGHVIDYFLTVQSTIGATETTFCNGCGAEVLTQCPGCHSPIWGGLRGSIPPRGPGYFCSRCGAPFPWANRQAIVYRLENLLEEGSDLDAQGRLELKEKIEVLTSDDSPEKSRLAAGQFIKRSVPGAWRIAEPVLRSILTAAVLKELGIG